MNINSLITQPSPSPSGPVMDTQQAQSRLTRRTGSDDEVDTIKQPKSSARVVNDPPKETVFKLVVSEDQRQYARLPLRIRVNKCDQTQSIIDTVKAFFGLPENMGVSFEDTSGYKIVPQYDNFVKATEDAGEYIVRVLLVPDANLELSPAGEAPPALVIPPHSVSPLKLEDIQKPNLFESRPAGSDAGSVSSSRRDNLASAEISVDNIVEGGRRKWAKFESSALPLFNPPQIPASASLSSVSPQRRLTNTGMPSPLPSNQYTFSYGAALPSPMSFNTSEKGYGQAASNGYSSYGASQRLRGRGSISTPRLSANSAHGGMPTPAPTISSAMSDEDVALQLIRLGDPNNLSLGRTSTSTVDDALSGKADAASSDEDEDGDIDAHPGSRKRTSSVAGLSKNKKRKLPKLQTNMGGIGDAESEEEEEFDTYKAKSGKSLLSRSNSSVGQAPRPKLPGKTKSRQLPGQHLGQPVRAESVASSVDSPATMADAGDEDLSMLPRCQRCRKSKKGCDRQRPCGRCKDAGIGIEGCISEDEGNGRKGRFGRHMGVPVKTSGEHEHQAFETVSIDSNGKKRKK